MEKYRGDLNMIDKEKLLKKTKLIFTVEYLLIAAVVIVIGFLRMFDIMEYSEKRLLIYNIITLVGVAYLIFDLIFNTVKKERREKICWVDKILTGIAGLYLLVFDILVLSKVLTDLSAIKYSVASVLLYAGAVSTFLGIYHYKYPSKQVLEVVEEEYNQKLQELEEEKKKEEEKASKEDKEN